MTQLQPEPTDGETYVREDDFSVADVAGDTHAVLAQLRTRLLDLTLTNRLLNFKQTSPRVVRVIDELPDQLFQRLREGDELEFLPVPELPRDHALRTESGAVIPKKDRPRAALAFASECGLSTSFELPEPSAPSAAVPDRHQDKAIQTLVFPEDLEKTLRAIASEARSAIEEKGSNILYLAFGFLEWFEREDTKRALQSPLLLLPVSLRRGDPDRKTGAYRFFLSYSEDDILPNISLQEKLRRDFNVALPDLEDDDTPERYFDRISSEVPLLPGWRVRRQISLGLLVFAKLFMYRDLDPKNWPQGTSPAEHPRLIELFGGASGEASGEKEYAHEYDFEGDSAAGGAPPAIPPIIVDADSSQHSAIVDAMQGRSLVIEGPPGTGKSQTIANLIAAALAERKSVLFVADKLTALEVVHRRLDEHGLGVFCLELHSDKTQKSRLMDDIRQRREARGTFRDPATLGERLRVLLEAKTRLNTYAKKVNSTFGALGCTIHDVLWGAQRRRSLLGAATDEWKDVVFENVEQLHVAGLETLQGAARAFAKAIVEVRPDGRRLDEHPFWAVRPHEPRSDAEDAIVRSLEDLQRSAMEGLTRLKEARIELATELPEGTTDLSAWLAYVQYLSQQSEGVALAAVAGLEQTGVRADLSAWCRDVTAWRARNTELQRRLTPQSAFDALRNASDALLLTFTPQVRVDELVLAREVIGDLTGHLHRAVPLLEEVALWLGDTTLPRTLDAVCAVGDLFDLVRTTPFDALPFRSAAKEDADPLIEASERRAAELRAERVGLAQHFHLDLLPEPEVLESHAATCATAGFFSFFSGAYRAAKRQYAILAKQPGNAGDAAMASAFQALSAHAKRLRGFEASEELRQALGPSFQGLDTRFDAIRSVREWQARVAGLQRRHRTVSQRIGDVTVTASARLRELSDLAGAFSAAEATSLRTRVHATLAMRPATVDHGGISLTGLITALDDIKTQADALGGLFRFVGAHVAPNVATLRDLRGELLAVEVERVRLASHTLPATVFGPTWGTVDAPLRLIERTLEYAATFWSDGTPPALRTYLLARPTADTFERIHGLLLAARNGATAAAAAESRFLDAASVQITDWYGAAEAPRQLQTMVDRSHRALAAREALPSWLSYVRARAGLARAGGDKIRERVEQQTTIDVGRLDLVAEFVVYASLARRAFERNPDLHEYDGLSLTAARERFRAYDVEIMKLQRERIAQRIDDQPVPEGVRSPTVKNRTELALLDHELGKQRAHIPIRQLVNRAGGALRALKPCFMMSPRSAAQYLQAGRHEFDLVVMDEASQLRPEDAIGAIARAKQAVIVGDSKQLPPTSFFTSAATDEDAEEEFVTENKESILDLARTTYRPVRQLRWHYRSKHGSLIAFSNERYYGGNLIVFPSPSDATEGLGVRLVEVSDGLYADGLNRKEAERVADAVLDHLKNHPEESFGVVALNVRQKGLLEQIIYDRLKDEPELRQRFDRIGETEPAFIKNLESVQGDERDVIFISVTYGPSTLGGRVARRFGPINGTSGWRRLNVLFTRAKRRVVVFSSFSPEQLAEGGASGLSRGAADLAAYLTFARTGKFQTAAATERAPDSDFEVEVAEVLRNAGYPVVPQVGVAGYFIDLAVQDPLRKAEYILGVECDGATYHSSFSARDRDRLRQQVLEGLGWRIHRIWSTDWFRDPRGEGRRLIEAVRVAQGAA